MKWIHEQKLYRFFFIFFIISFISCEKEVTLNESQQESSENFISAAMAFNVAEMAPNTEEMLSLRSTKSDDSFPKKDKVVETIFSVKDENGSVVYYIINYKNGGFIIVSADNRTEPVLAYSEDTSFPINSSSLIYLVFANYYLMLYCLVNSSTCVDPSGVDYTFHESPIYENL